MCLPVSKAHPYYLGFLHPRHHRGSEVLLPHGLVEHRLLEQREDRSGQWSLLGWEGLQYHHQTGEDLSRSVTYGVEEPVADQ